MTDGIQGDTEAARLKKLSLALRDTEKKTVPVSEFAGKAGGDNFQARMTEALNIGHRIAETMGKLGDYDREETEAFVRSLEAQVKDWAAQLLARKEKNLAELKRIVGEIAK